MMVAPPPPHGFLSVDAQRRRATITLIASYDGENGGYNFDGYSRDLMWTVPRGWTVRVMCENRGPLRHSCAVVRGPSSAQPAFRGASTPQPQIGLEAGHRASFTFRAGNTGSRASSRDTRTRACGTCSRSRAEVGRRLSTCRRDSPS
jgi:hypothetical protein